MNAEIQGTSEARFLLVKRGLYYRPQSSGYTGIKRNAGRYPANMANPAAGVTAVHEDHAPIYAPGTFHDLAVADFVERVIELTGGLPGHEELKANAIALTNLLAGFPDGEGLPA